MDMKLLFKNAKIVDTSSPYHLEQVDILIHEGQIQSIGAISDQSLPTIDLNGAIVTTGFAELHSDLGEPGNEESETLQTGAAAAAAGGFTAVGVVSNGAPFTDSKTGVEFILSKGDSSAINLIPIGTMSKHRDGEELSEMFEMNEAGSPLFGDYKRGVENANLLKLALLYTKPFGAIMVHPEDAHLSSGGMMNEGATSTYVGLKGLPSLAEYVQISRDLKVLEYTEGAMHIASVSTAEGIAAIAEAKNKGLNVSCSVNIHHLIFSEEDLEGYDTSLKVNPPLRSKSDVEALVQALKDGVVDCLTVDHLPKDIEQKQCEFDNAAWGMASFEGAVAVLLDKYDLPMDLIQQVLSVKPRQLLNLPKLSIMEGEIAEFTIIDKEGQDWTGFASKAHNNPFRGTETKTRIKGVFVNDTYLGF